MSAFTWLRPRRRPRPPQGFIWFVTAKGNRMAQLTGTVTLSAPDPKVAVTKRTVTVAINGATPIVLDATAGHASFNCNDGDQVNVSAVDQSSGGVDSAPATAAVVAHDSITVPASPTVAVAFAPATEPTPAPAAS